MTAARNVAIVGGGIIGLASAHYLQRAGCRVTVIDKGKIGGECSHGNCGLICPSHVLPLAEPGAIRSTLKAMLQPQSPFHIRPRPDLALWKWLWNFSRRCNTSDMLTSAQAIQPLLAESLRLYQSLIHDEGLASEFQKQGLLFVYRTRKALDAYDPTNELLTSRFNEPARKLVGDEVQEFEPSLKSGLAGGWYFEHDAHLRPDRLIAAWRRKLESVGVNFVEGQRLLRFESEGGRVDAVVLERDRLEADQVLMATGAWTPHLESILKYRIPIEPGKGYSVTIDRPDPCPRVPMLLPEHRVGVTPMESQLRLGSVMEFAGYDTSIRPERLRLLTNGAAHYLRAELSRDFHETWYGWRPMTYDSTPVIGPCPTFANVFLATGHSMLGLSMAPATGRLISEIMSGQSPFIPAEPYRATRFAGAA